MNCSFKFLFMKVFDFKKDQVLERTRETAVMFSVTRYKFYLVSFMYLFILFLHNYTASKTLSGFLRDTFLSCFYLFKTFWFS
jgi:hypothetical protein